MKKTYKKPVIEVGTALGDEIICQTIGTSGEYGGGEILSKDRRERERNQSSSDALWDTKW